MDPMVRDKKSLPLSGASVIPTFLGTALIVTPLLLTVFLPITLLYQAYDATSRMILKKKKSHSSQSSDTPKVLMKSSDTKSRKYDLIVFGATGFTGKMAAVYIAKTYGSSFSWAIAGRRKDGLEKIRDELVKINTGLKDLPLVIADSGDMTSLHEMTKSTKCVITTAGPFAKYGSSLVESCAVNGTHYCDITGETDWVRKMVDQYDEVAKLSGARIVNFCGHDCIPWDLAVLECVNELKKKGETITEISFFDEINSAPSGGTLATAALALGERAQYKSKLGFDPLLKTATGVKSENKLTAKNQASLGFSKKNQTWVGPFVMAMVMANCVRRSNALNNYTTKLVYKESLVFPGFMAGFVNLMGLAVTGVAIFCPPLLSLFKAINLLPAPGAGPSEATMDEGFLKITGFAKGSNGTSVKVMFYCPTDPGYRDTARMLVESGLVLALQGNQVKVQGGVWTPAACQGTLLMERLITSGSSLEIE